MRTTHSIWTLSVAIGLLACGGANQGTPVPGTAANTPSASTEHQAGADRAVVEQLANARCYQEQGCGNIGAGQKYVSRDICMEQMRGNLGNEYNASECPGGIDQSAVDRCMSAIKGEECDHPLDTITRADTCRNGALCIK